MKQQQLTIPYPEYKRSPARLRNRERIREMDRRRMAPEHRRLDEAFDDAIARDHRARSRP